MYMLFVLSAIRYVTVLHIPFAKKFLERHSCLTILLCWICGLVWAVPPLFGGFGYVPEGLGFHCGLNWQNSPLNSRLYFVSIFLLVYFIPLTLLLYANMRVYHTIRHLIYRSTINEPQRSQWELLRISASSTRPAKFSSHQLKTSSGSNTTSDLPMDATTYLCNPCITITASKTINIMRKSSNNTDTPVAERIKKKSIRTRNLSTLECSYLHDGRDIRRQLSDKIIIRNSARLKRLKADKRFALATLFLVSEYLLSWTPYAILILLELFGISSSSKTPLLMTECALIAKLAMVLNPLIYIRTIEMNKLMPLLCKKHTCRSQLKWRVKRDIRRFSF
ncbi:unnamed protein product [Didymodactylos carnosus]|uniref:G-protein coupled receptors family 1 profile domain-containing protein n=1 Tax=Didymodactylos carnosus TaxID=1234261 RepID=A0A8S2EBG2_9BILA|nr:unnamed protein product [Didymodactylos carnosus]CAF3991799.1 unnamed protein product [Didymodactylos carnosus]